VSSVLPSHVKLLVESKDPVCEVWRILTEIWRPLDDLKEHFSKDREKIASRFEYQLNRVFYEIYQHLHTSIHESTKRFKSPLLIVDGLSVREGGLLARDLELKGYKVLRYWYSFSALPSNTSSFRKVLKGRFREVKSGRVPSYIDFSVPVWISYPDEILHHAGRIISPYEAYERTRSVILKVLDRIVEKSCVVTITSDHGYVVRDVQPWPISKAVRTFLRSIFGGSRFVKVEDIDKNKLKHLKEIPEEDSYVFIDDEYCYVKGRYFWPIQGYRSNVDHGGLSLTECIVPLIEVEV